MPDNSQSNDMLQAATVWPLPGTMPWGSSERSADTPAQVLAPVAPGDALYLDVATPPPVLAYGQRDRQLSYRDLVVTSYATALAYAAATVWNSKLPRVALPGPVFYNLPSNGQPGLPNVAADRPAAPGTPGRVAYPPLHGLPRDEVATDQSLYARDLVLVEALARAALSLGGNYRPFAPYTGADGWAIDNRWDFAQGQSSLAQVGLQLPFGRKTFMEPDQNLAARDNVLASLVGQLSRLLRNPYEHASRLYLRLDGSDPREPESYVLVFEDARTRVFAAEPFYLAGGTGLRLIYDRYQGTVRWRGEFASQLHPARRITQGLGKAAGQAEPLVFATVAGQVATVLREAPQLYSPLTGYGFDVQFLRQKSARFCFENSRFEGQRYLELDVHQGTLLGDPDSPGTLQHLTNYDPTLTIARNGFAYRFNGWSLTASTWRASFMLRPWAIGVVNGGALSDTTCAGPCGSNPGVQPLCDTADDPAVELTATLGGVSASACAAFQPGRTESVSFDFPLSAVAANPLLTLQLSSRLFNVLALQVVSVDVGVQLTPIRQIDPTVSESLRGFNHELLRRAEAHLQALHQKMLTYALVPDARRVQVQAGRTVAGYALACNHPDQLTYVGAGVAVVFSQSCAVGTRWIFLGKRGQLPRTATVVSVSSSSQNQYAVILDTSLGDTLESGTAFRYGTASFSATNLPPDLALDAYTGIVQGTVRATSQPGEVKTLLATAFFLSDGTQTSYSQPVTFVVQSALSRAPHPGVPFTWNADCTDSWMLELELLEPRLRTLARSSEQAAARAFRLGKPGDVGRLPALVPEGLQLDDSGEIVANYPTRSAYPVLRTFQPWMLEAGIYVAQEDWFGALTVPAATPLPA